MGPRVRSGPMTATPAPTTGALLHDVPQRGTLDWIGLRTERRGAVLSVHETEALAGIGLDGDRRSRNAPRPTSTRHVTLIQAEHLPVVAALLGREAIDPALTRRNLLVRGINLRSLKGRRFQVGGAVLEGINECHPCSRMEENLGTGGFQAMRGHGGLNARVLESGTIAVGATVTPLPAP